MSAAELYRAAELAGIALWHARPGEQRLPCPPCNRGPKDDSLGVTILGDGSAMASCFRCRWGWSWRPSRPIERNSRRRDISTAMAMQAPLPIAKPKDWSVEAEAIIRETEPDHALLRTYFAARGFGSIATPLAIRYLRPGVAPAGTLPGWPRMVGIITDVITNQPISLHFTALAHDGTGKAPIDRPKRLLAGHRKQGGCIRLCADCDATLGLGLSEGIETGLAVMSAGWLPVWAAIDAGNMAGFPTLAGIESLTLFADHDGAGLRATEQCSSAWRVAGREACIVNPRTLGADWADEAAA